MITDVAERPLSVSRSWTVVLPAETPETTPVEALSEAYPAPEITDHCSLDGVRRTASPLLFSAEARRVTVSPIPIDGLLGVTLTEGTELSKSMVMAVVLPAEKLICTVLLATALPLASRASLITS